MLKEYLREIEKMNDKLDEIKDLILNDKKTKEDERNS